MTKIKICGLRRTEDVRILNRERPDYAGFVFAKSRRQVDVSTAARLIAQLRDDIQAVGVFVNETMEQVQRTAKESGLAVIQLHGDESPEYVRRLREQSGLPVWKALRIAGRESLRQIGRYEADIYLLDTFSAGQYGGAGRRFDWSWLHNISCDRVVLAGGLTPENCGEALRMAAPFGIDVSSGVETEGWKDSVKIRRLIDNIRRQ